MIQKHDSGFPKGFSFSLRPSRMIFLAIMLLAVLSVIWPGYYLFSDTTPFILGFPLSFAWIIFWVVVCFAALMGLYISDVKNEEKA